MRGWGVPQLSPDLLATIIPTGVYGGGVVGDLSHTLFVWRTVATEKAHGGMLAFFLDDARLETVWRSPDRYTQQFLRHEVASLVEVDFSLWADDPLPVQLHNVYRQRALARRWQEAGLIVAPCLNWSDERSFEFCFSGVPRECPVAFTECRTAASSAEDRRAFNHGLHEAIRQVRPQTLVIYGGRIHEWWIRRDLPACATEFVFLESWTDARRCVRAEQTRQVRDRNQLNLFGGDTWAFLRGLTEGVRQVRPQHLMIYGGREHSFWLNSNLPQGPRYTLIESWMSARRKVHSTQARREREKYQLPLFGGEAWAEEAQQVAV